MRLKCALIGIVTISLVLNACTAMYSVPIPTGPEDHRAVIMSGDRARVWLNDGTRHDVTGVSVQSDHILATEGTSKEERRFDYAQMKELWVHEVRKRREPWSTGKKVGVTVLAVVGVLAATFLYLVHQSAKNSD